MVKNKIKISGTIGRDKCIIEINPPKKSDRLTHSGIERDAEILFKILKSRIPVEVVYTLKEKLKNF